MDRLYKEMDMGSDQLYWFYQSISMHTHIELKAQLVQLYSKN